MVLCLSFRIVCLCFDVVQYQETPGLQCCAALLPRVSQSSRPDLLLHREVCSVYLVWTQPLHFFGALVYNICRWAGIRKFCCPLFYDKSRCSIIVGHTLRCLCRLRFVSISSSGFKRVALGTLPSIAVGVECVNV